MKGKHFVKGSMAAIACALISNFALAQCELNSNRSVVFADNTQVVCIKESDQAKNLTLSELLSKTEPTSNVTGQTDSYWDQWAYNMEDVPVLTQSVDTNYFGLGFWMPEDLAEKEDEYSTEEWLMNHGLLFSFGVGDKRSNEARLRFDYRWHDKYEADWLMQIEVPFN